MSLTRKEIFDVIKNNIMDNNDALFNIIEQHLSDINKETFILCTPVKRELRKLFYKLRNKFQQCNKTYEKFYATNESWLAMEINLWDKSKNVEDSEEPSTSSGRPRPSIQFEGSSERTKRRRTQEIREQHSVQELSYATQMSLRAVRKLDAANIVKDITLGSPSKATQYKKAIERIQENTLSGNSALSLMIEQKLSKSQYEGLRNMSLQHDCKLYPSYKAILEAKRQCYPSKSDIIITEICAEVRLQALLDHTVQRILLSQMDVIKSLTAENVRSMDLICKWGCDGTSGQSMYKQKFSDDDGTKSDANIFFTSLVPLQLISNDIIVWKNPRPSSPRFCRPLRIQFLHESTTATVNEADYIKDQQNKLTSFETIMDGKEITVSYKLALTMIDGKICNALTSNSSTQRCYLCNATSKEFNDIDTMLQRQVHEDNFHFGLSTLHAWIRFFECFLHMSYKLEIKKWQARTSENKEKVAARKKCIQKGFRLQLGLIVDQPKPGYGSTNDGNTARRFFENPTVSASITGIDEDIIKRFHVVLQAISSGYEIHINKFQEYALETARKFVLLYPWYYMPTTVHKILIHGPKIIASSLLPIGQMSEDAQESCNKYIKKFREDFSRKCSRIKTMEDIFLRLLVASDPFISGLRKLPHKNLKSLTSDAVQLLIPPTIKIRNETSTAESESESCDSSGLSDDE